MADIIERKTKATYTVEIPGVVMSKKNNMIVIKMGNRSSIGKKKEYKDWESSLSWLALKSFREKYGHGIKLPFTGELVTVLKIWPKDRRKDTINALAGVADGLEWNEIKKPDGLYRNDRQMVDARIVFMWVDKKNPRFEFDISLVDDGQGDFLEEEIGRLKQIQENQKGGVNVKSESKERQEKRKQVRGERQASTDEREIEYETVRERRQKNRSKSN